MAYKEKIDPTRDGFQELWDSTKSPTIERLMAGIQARKTTKEEILKLTGDLRDSHTILDRELLRLGDFAQDYNSLWATKKTYNLSTTEQLQNKTKSQYLRWKKVLKATTPRYKKTPRDDEEPQTLIEKSYMTYRPFELDLWGPQSYGTLITDLYNEVVVVVDHLDEGERMCKDTLSQEEKIDKDPEWKAKLYDRQFKDIVDRNRDTIERRYQSGICDTSNPLYKEMLSYPSEEEYKSAKFHDPNESQFSDFVINLTTLRLQEREITPKEGELWGDDFEKINMVRFAIAHADELLSIKKNGHFEGNSIVEMIKWANVLQSTKSHTDSERVFYDYLKETYRGAHKWPGWPSVFGINKMVKESPQDTIAHATRFERRLNRLLVELKDQ
jgi:hypothetical protein